MFSATTYIERRKQLASTVSSGLITGEALVGILLAIPFAASQSTDVLAVAPDGFEPIANVLGIISLCLFCLWLFRTARGNRS